MKDVKEIDSEVVLETIESVFNKGGIEAVKNWVATEFAIGTLVSLKQGVPDEKLYNICDYAIVQMNSAGTVLPRTYLSRKNDVEDCSLIRVLALSYVSQPFQIELYGGEVSE